MMLFLFNVQLRNKYDDDDDDGCYNTIRTRFDGHSTAYQRSSRSQWRI